MKNKLGIISLTFSVLAWVLPYLFLLIPYISTLGPGYIICGILSGELLLQFICMLIGIVLPILILRKYKNESKLFAITSILISLLAIPVIVLRFIVLPFCGG